MSVFHAEKPPQTFTPPSVKNQPVLHLQPPHREDDELLSLHLYPQPETHSPSLHLNKKRTTPPPYIRCVCGFCVYVDSKGVSLLWFMCGDIGLEKGLVLLCKGVSVFQCSFM